MLDIRDLEKRWLHYKIKSYIPHAVILVSLVVISSITFFALHSSTNAKQQNVKEVTQKEVLPLKETKTTLKTKTSIIEKAPKVKITPLKKEASPSKMTIEPSLNFMKKMQSATSPYYNEVNNYNTPPKIKKKKIVKSKPVIEETQDVVVKEKTIEEEPIEKVNKISIKMHDTKDDIAEIITRFKKNNNPALSLFVAKKYYELGEYKKSYNYALITNQINNEIDASWIIFTKSLVKLGKKKMAVRTLQTYIQNSHSNSAQLLLEEIRTGKFK